MKPPMRMIPLRGLVVRSALAALLTGLGACLCMGQQNNDQQYTRKVSVKRGKKLGENLSRSLSGGGSRKSLRKGSAPYSDRSFANRPSQPNTSADAFHAMFDVPPAAPAPQERAAAPAAAADAPARAADQTNHAQILKDRFIKAGIVCKWLDKTSTGGLTVDLSGCKSLDLSLMKDMPVVMLNLKDSTVQDVAALAGLKLVYLNIEGTEVRDISALKGMPLTDFKLRNTPVEDVSPVEGMPLRSIAFSIRTVTKGLDVVRAMKSIRMIYGENNAPVTPAEFWSKNEPNEGKKDDKS